MSGRSTQAKKDRIRWFLKTQRLKREEARELLRLLLRSDDLIARIDFVKDVEPHKDVLLISAQGTGTFPFLFRTNGQVVQDVGQAVELLREAPPDQLKVWLSCGEAAEDEVARCDDTTTRLLAVAQQVLGQMQAEFSERELMASRLLEQIHQTLEIGDKEAFERLSAEYRRVKNWLRPIRR